MFRILFLISLTLLSCRTTQKTSTPYDSSSDNSSVIALTAARSAVMAGGKWIVVAYGDRDIEVFDATSKKKVWSFANTTKATFLGLKGDLLWAYGKENDTKATFFKLSISDKKVSEQFIVDSTGTVSDLIVLDQNNAILVQRAGSSVSPRAQVVSLANKRNGPDLGSITTGIYGKLGYDFEGTQLYLPGGYPGLIRSVDFSDANNVKYGKSYATEDWLQDVKKISADSYVGAGSSLGIFLYNVKPDNESSGPVHLSDTVRANLLLNGKTLFASSAGKLETFNLETNETSSLEIKMTNSQSKYLYPLGINESHELVLLEGTLNFVAVHFQKVF